MRLGITGNVGSGKSTVGEEMERLGALRIDADKIVHELYEASSPLCKKIASLFGQDCLAADGSVDRARLGAKVFDDPSLLEQLNMLVHPQVRHRVEELMRLALPQQHIVVEAALLIEGGWTDMFDKIILVVASRKHRERRLVRRGMSPQRINQVMGTQTTSHEKLPHAHIILDNDGTQEELLRQVNALWQTLPNM